MNIKQIYCLLCCSIFCCIIFFSFNILEALAKSSNIYRATINPSQSDQGDKEIPGTIAWNLEQGADYDQRKIYLTSGTYYVSSGIEIPNNTQLIGKGKMKTKVKASEALTEHIFYNAHSRDASQPGIKNIVIKSMHIKGKRKLRKNCIQLIAKNKARSSNITLNNLTIRKCGRHGAHIKGANNVTVENSKFYKNGQNIYHDHNLYLLRVTNATIKKIHTTGASSNGFSSTRLENAKLSKITSFKNGNRGIRFGGGKNIVLSKSKVYKNGLLSEHQADGIVVTSDDYDNTSSKITIKNTTSSRNPGSGVAVDFARNVSIENVKTKKNKQCKFKIIHSTVFFSQNQISKYNAFPLTEEACL